MNEPQSTLKALETFLGPLEARIMLALWSECTTARAVQAHLAEHDKLVTNSTVRTVLDRLVRKGLLSVNENDKTFEYKPVDTTPQLFLLRHFTKMLVKLKLYDPKLLINLYRIVQGITNDKH